MREKRDREKNREHKGKTKPGSSSFALPVAPREAAAAAWRRRRSCAACTRLRLRSASIGAGVGECVRRERGGGRVFIGPRAARQKRRPEAGGQPLRRQPGYARHHIPLPPAHRLRVPPNAPSHPDSCRPGVGRNRGTRNKSAQEGSQLVEGGRSKGDLSIFLGAAWLE